MEAIRRPAVIIRIALAAIAVTLISLMAAHAMSHPEALDTDRR